MAFTNHLKLIIFYFCTQLSFKTSLTNTRQRIPSILKSQSRVIIHYIVHLLRPLDDDALDGTLQVEVHIFTSEHLLLCVMNQFYPYWEWEYGLVVYFAFYLNRKHIMNADNICTG